MMRQPQQHSPFKLVAIEGTDGAGKATQAKMLVERMEASMMGRGQVIDFPQYDSPSGKVLKDHLHGGWSCMEHGRQLGALPVLLGHTDMMARQAFMTCNRYEAQDKIKAALMTGHVVLDRYWMSSLAYGMAEGLDRSWVEDISSSMLQPDLWIFLDVPSGVGALRKYSQRKGEVDLNEADVNKLARVRQNYIEEFEALAAQGTGRAVVIDGNRAPYKVRDDIWSAFCNIPGNSYLERGR